jgi:hypothetical protein
MFRPDCQSCGRTGQVKDWPCERFAAVPNRDAVRRGEGAVCTVYVCWLRLYRDRPGLRTILANAGVMKPPILDWLLIAMRLQHTKLAAASLSIEPILQPSRHPLVADPAMRALA